MGEFTLPFPPPSAPESGPLSPGRTLDGNGLPESLPSGSESGHHHPHPQLYAWFRPGTEPPDLVEPPFAGVATGFESPAPVPTPYLAAVESAWYQLNGGGCGFSADDLECLAVWHRLGIPLEFVTQVIREHPTHHSQRFTGGRRRRIYRLRYFDAEIRRRWKRLSDSPPPVTGHASPEKKKRVREPEHRSGIASRRMEHVPDSLGEMAPGVAPPGGLPSLPTERLSAEKAGFFRQELCTLLDELATTLEAAPRLWALHKIPLPRTTQACLGVARSIREAITLIERSCRACILDLETTLMAWDEEIWATMKNELDPSVVRELMSGLSQDDMLRARPPTASGLLERERRLRRLLLERHQLPPELTVAAWWESVVVPAGGGASF